MEWWPFLIFHRGGLRIKVINNRGRMDREHRRHGASSKTVLVLPLVKDPRRVLRES